MCCSVLQCVAVQFHMYVAVCCSACGAASFHYESVLQAPVCCSVLQCVAVCSVRCHVYVAMHVEQHRFSMNLFCVCSMLQCLAVSCSKLQCVAVHVEQRHSSMNLSCKRQYVAVCCSVFSAVPCVCCSACGAASFQYESVLQVPCMIYICLACES